MSSLLLTKLNSDKFDVWINPTQIVSIVREIPPKTTLHLPEQNYLTVITLTGNKSVVTSDTPEEIIQAIKATPAFNWNEGEDFDFADFSPEDYLTVINGVKNVLKETK